MTTNRGGREAMLLQKTSDSGREPIPVRRSHSKGFLAVSLPAVCMTLLFSGCSLSPQNAYAVKTADYGQCRSLQKGEKIRYKNRPVRFVCEGHHILYGKPYQSKDGWYFKSGGYKGTRIEEAPPTRVEKILHDICQLEGSYGTGTQKVRKFYFNTKVQSCMPFVWSGEGGVAPFDSQDICEMNCYY